MFVSLSCHNCPDVVQTVNQFALLNDRIQAEMIDGGLFQETIKERDIQGVPSVYLNGKVFANGKVTAAELIEKLMALYPATTGVPEAAASSGCCGGWGWSCRCQRSHLQRQERIKRDLDRRPFGRAGQRHYGGIENLISVPKTTGPATGWCSPGTYE